MVLEVLMPGIRHGEAIMNTSIAYRGMIAYIEGVDSNGAAVINIPRSSANAKKAFYPVNKLLLRQDASDTAPSIIGDKIQMGKKCLYYEGGRYRSDQVVRAPITATSTYSATSTGAKFGTRLWVDFSTVNAGKIRINKNTAFSAGTAFAVSYAYQGNNSYGFIDFKVRTDLVF